MVELVPCTILGVLVRSEVLADMTIASPLAQHEGLHLLAQCLARSAGRGHIVVALQPPIRQLHHGAPHKAPPIAQRWVRRVVRRYARQTPIASVGVPIEVAVGCDAKARAVHHPLRHHLVDLLFGWPARQHWVERGRRDAAVERSVWKFVDEGAGGRIPQLLHEQPLHGPGPCMQRGGLRPADGGGELGEGLRLHGEHRRHADVVQQHLVRGVVVEVAVVHRRVVEARLQACPLHVFATQADQVEWRQHALCQEPTAPIQQVIEEQLNDPLVLVLLEHLEEDLRTDGRLCAVGSLARARCEVGHETLRSPRLDDLDEIAVCELLRVEAEKIRCKNVVPIEQHVAPLGRGGALREVPTPAHGCDGTGLTRHEDEVPHHTRLRCCLDFSKFPILLVGLQFCGSALLQKRTDIGDRHPFSGAEADCLPLDERQDKMRMVVSVCEPP
mmetsp:Transcript_137525/g.439004  ORF Transcript_137525/g.439004 Transcript_137525/m.439004 type:complete len:443 (-) Transcript_137525:133-1461(-)